MLLQLYGDLPEHFPGHERRLYIFICRKKACRRKEGSIRAIRSVKVLKSQESCSKSKSPTLAKHNLGDSLFGNKAGGRSTENPFSSAALTKSNNVFSSLQPLITLLGTEDYAPLKSLLAPILPQPPFITVSNELSATFAHKSRISSPPSIVEPAVPYETWPVDLPYAYPQYSLDADYETLDAAENAAVCLPAVNYDETDEASHMTAVSGKKEPDSLESSMDKTFQRFADCLAQNPLQVLRYEFRGSPLLYSKSDAVGKRLAPYQSSSQSNNTKVSTSGRISSTGIPPCVSCGSARVFEFQLTPQAICELEVDEIGLEGMDWGTIIVGVCREDCQAKGVELGQVGYLEEWVGVQWEEVSMPRR